MTKPKNLLLRVLEGHSDANIRFDDLCTLLLRCGFQMRMSGSHHIFRLEGVEERITSQRDGD